MILRTKIIIGAILGVLWIALCIGLAIMPEPKEIKFSYMAQINAHEIYKFSMNDYSVKIEHIVKNGEESVVEIYRGSMEEKQDGGLITVTEAKSVERAYDLDLNVKPIALIGQKYIIPFKYVGDYMVIYLNDKYVCLTEQNFTTYEEVIGLYGKNLSEYKNPNIDIYIKKGESNLKQVLFEQLYAVSSTGNCSKKYFENVEEITEILYNNKTFDAKNIGNYSLKIKTSNDKTILVNAKVYDDNTLPYKNNLQIQSETLKFKQTARNDVSAFLQNAKLKIKFFGEKTFITVTSKMIDNLNTSIKGAQIFEINYKDCKYYAEALIYENTEDEIKGISTNSNLFVIKHGDDSFLHDLTITASYFNGYKENNIKVYNNDLVKLEGFNKDRIIKQIVTLKYNNCETRILVIVLNEEDYNYYLENNSLPK